MELDAFQIKELIPIAIKAGLGLYKTACWMHIGMARLRTLATETQLREFEKNGEASMRGGNRPETLKLFAKNPLDELREFKYQASAASSPLTLEQRISQCIANGMSVTDTMSELSISHGTLHKEATEQQIFMLRKNGKARMDQRMMEINHGTAGMRVIKDQAIAKQRMQEIISGRHYV